MLIIATRIFLYCVLFCKSINQNLYHIILLKLLLVLLNLIILYELVFRIRKLKSIITFFSIHKYNTPTADIGFSSAIIENLDLNLYNLDQHNIFT